MSSFVNIPESNEKEYKATEYVKLTSGVPVRMRILDEKAYHTTKHFIPNQKVSVLCLGDEHCPICQTNARLFKENPELSPRQIKGIIPRQNRYMVNVLNRTMVKTTSVGTIVYPVHGQFPTNDPDTGELLVNISATPLNRVQVLERGPTLFSQLNVINDSVTDENGNPKGIWTFDIVITSSGTGRKTTTNVIPYPDQNDVIPGTKEELDEKKYVLSSLGLQVTANEMRQLLNGVSLKDVFASRKASNESELTSDEGEISEDVVDKVNKILF
jgi:hypothetical protein